MASNLKFTKELVTFLGKSVIALLETLIFTFIPRPRKNVAGEIVLITGAGRGLGRLLALRFAHLGSVLVLWDINKEGNEETCRMAREAGATRVYAYTCDCSQKEEIYRVAEQVKKEVGDVSILINNAGVVTGSDFLNCPDDLMEKSLDVNFKAHLWTYKCFLPAMIANDHGHLVCISSSAGLVGVNKLAETIVQKLKGIKTTIVCPFFINTGMFEGCSTVRPFLLPILEPEYVVEKIVDAILKEKVYLYVPRFLYFVMVLKSILPVKIALLLSDFMGVFNIMDGFVFKNKKH
uniref:Short chain dehydrogenase/reductase family 16C member 5 n=1 Tax=Felis catus TaxID=9685 RepID=A0ABI7XZ42_FELCA